MSEFLKNIANLIKVKTIVTMVVITVFAWLALTGRITSVSMPQPENALSCCSASA